MNEVRDTTCGTPPPVVIDFWIFKAMGVGEVTCGPSCSIYYNVKPSLEVRADRKASMPNYQNVEKKIAAIPTV